MSKIVVEIDIRISRSNKLFFDKVYCRLVTYIIVLTKILSSLGNIVTSKLT